jgi:hypothetical protein
LSAAPPEVFNYLNSESGRIRFWAEQAPEQDGKILFKYPNGLSWQSRIFERKLNQKLSLEYIAGSKVTFLLTSVGEDGTDLEMNEENYPEKYFSEISAGWVSVLLALKAAVDFKVDLRNHDKKRT